MIEFSTSQARIRDRRETSAPNNLIVWLSLTPAYLTADLIRRVPLMTLMPSGHCSCTLLSNVAVGHHGENATFRREINCCVVTRVVYRADTP